MNGIEREIDKLGRVVIPMEFRKQLGIESDSKVSICLADGEVIIRPRNCRCALCGAGIESSRKIRLCDGCILKIREEY